MCTSVCLSLSLGRSSGVGLRLADDPLNDALFVRVEGLGQAVV